MPTTPQDQETLEEDLVVPVPGFRPLPAEDQLDPTTATVTGPEEDPTTPPPDQMAKDLGSGDGDGADGASGGARTRTTGSSPTSTPDASVVAAVASITGLLVGAAAMGVRLLRERMLRRELHPAAWAMDEDDKRAIGRSLARIAARHAPAGAGGSEDLADGIEAATAATGWAMHSLTAERLPWEQAPAEEATEVTF